MFPPELLKLRADYGDCIQYRMIRSERVGENLLLQLEIDVFEPYNNEIFTQYWQLEIVGYLSGVFSFSYFSNLLYEENHVLLWPYADVRCRLYFNGTAADTAALFAALYQAHQGYCGRHYPFEKFLNTRDSVIDLLQRGSGWLATGPKKLLMSYASCLQRHNVNYTLVPSWFQYPYRDGNSLEKDKKPLKILFMDDDYLIAEQFDFRRLS